MALSAAHLNAGVIWQGRDRYITSVCRDRYIISLCSDRYINSLFPPTYIPPPPPFSLDLINLMVSVDIKLVFTYCNSQITSISCMPSAYYYSLRFRPQVQRFWKWTAVMFRCMCGLDRIIALWMLPVHVEHFRFKLRLPHADVFYWSFMWASPFTMRHLCLQMSCWNTHMYMK